MSENGLILDMDQWAWKWRALFTPSCWLQNHPYSEVWDRKLRELLRHHDFTDIREHTARLGGVLIWTSNHPYASMRPYRGLCGPDTDRDVKVRASRATTLYAGERLRIATVGNVADEQWIEAL